MTQSSLLIPSAQPYRADIPRLESVCAIENVERAADHVFLQLQYSQTALLNFRGMSFPHVAVGTLIKAF